VSAVIAIAAIVGIVTAMGGVANIARIGTRKARVAMRVRATDIGIATAIAVARVRGVLPSHVAAARAATTKRAVVMAADATAVAVAAIGIVSVHGGRVKADHAKAGTARPRVRIVRRVQMKPQRRLLRIHRPQWQLLPLARLR